MQVQYHEASGQYCDIETGEIIPLAQIGKIFNNTNEPQPVLLPPDCSVRISKKRKPFKKAAREPFVMVFQQQIQQLIIGGQLSVNEKALLFSIFPFLTFARTIEIPGEDGKPRRLKMNDLYTLMGWSKTSKNTMGNVIDSLTEKGIIMRVKNGRDINIELNPLFFHVGTMEVREVRSKALRDKLEGCGDSRNDLGNQVINIKGTL
ncbi:hypothetical protein [Desulforamulus aquiferis]|uniref:HTH crp-type domain-containing protein n=1 Tax=Desulforamulus aquiferis TaxID=1397668 RepID=A0AAW7ZBT5_9FIRM|nr:hypothetical protein [Desulforamulus aquiferis]MDO7786995.1 hypothetical protein [Desulforamulus aquiferis]